MIGRDLRLDGLSLAGRHRPPLAPLDLTIAAGEHLGLIEAAPGPAATLLAVLAGRLAPDIGRIVIGGADVTRLVPPARPTQIVAADLGLFDGGRVADEIAFGPRARRLAAGEVAARTAHLLDRFALADLADAPTATLDRPQRVAVALARALAVEPAVLLLDAVFDGLAAAPRRALRDRLAALRRDDGLTVVERGGEPADLLADADRLAAFAADGRLLACDTPDRLWSAPPSLALARATGEVVVLPAEPIADDGPRPLVATALGRLRGHAAAPLAAAAVVVALRPERLVLADATTDGPDWNRFDAEFVAARLEGPTRRFTLRVDGTEIVLRRPDRGLHGLVLPGRLALAVHADDVLVLPAADDGHA